jgi:hypothetical protein
VNKRLLGAWLGERSERVKWYDRDVRIVHSFEF